MYNAFQSWTKSGSSKLQINDYFMRGLYLYEYAKVHSDEWYGELSLHLYTLALSLLFGS